VVVASARPVRGAPPSARGEGVRNEAPSKLSEHDLAAIDRAHAALAAGDTTAALAELDAFDARAPGSALAEEAAALRYDVLVARGDRAGAERAARAFVVRWPASPYAPRLRRGLSTGR
jgi:predicted Zn-dependent protease